MQTRIRKKMKIMDKPNDAFVGVPGTTKVFIPDYWEGKQTKVCSCLGDESGGKNS